MVLVKVLEGFVERLSNEEFLATVHGDDELVEVDFARFVLVHGLHHYLYLLLAVCTKICLVYLHEFAHVDHPVAVGVDLVEEVG